MKIAEESCTDQLLWQRLRSGDEKAFAILFQDYHRLLYNYGCKLSSDERLVEDAVQDVFIDLWRLRSSLAPKVQAVKFYLYRSLRRRIHLAKNKYESRADVNLQYTYQEVDLALNSQEEELIEFECSTQRAERIRELMANLPARQLEALTLRYYDNFSIEEIAKIMDVTEKSVRNTLYKALTSLRENRNWLVIPLLFPMLSLAI